MKHVTSLRPKRNEKERPVGSTRVPNKSDAHCGREFFRTSIHYVSGYKVQVPDIIILNGLKSETVLMLESIRRERSDTSAIEGTDGKGIKRLVMSVDVHKAVKGRRGGCTTPNCPGVDIITSVTCTFT